MSDPRPNLERYHDRLASESLAEDLPLKPSFVLVAAGVLALAALTSGEDGVRWEFLGVAALLVAVAWGLRSAAEWARWANAVILASAAVGCSVKLVQDPGPLLHGVVTVFLLIGSAAMASELAGPRGRERFRRARAHRERSSAGEV